MADAFTEMNSAIGQFERYLFPIDSQHSVSAWSALHVSHVLDKLLKMSVSNDNESSNQRHQVYICKHVKTLLKEFSDFDLHI